MKKILMFGIVLLLVAMAGCIENDEKSLEDFFEETRDEVSLTNETVRYEFDKGFLAYKGQYFVGRIKSVNETTTKYGSRSYFSYIIIFEDGTKLKSCDMGMFPYRVGEVHGIELRSDEKYSSLGRSVHKVIF